MDVLSPQFRRYRMLARRVPMPVQLTMPHGRWLALKVWCGISVFAAVCLGPAVAPTISLSVFGWMGLAMYAAATGFYGYLVLGPASPEAVAALEEASSRVRRLEGGRVGS